jgi:hypothetical protein
MLPKVSAPTLICQGAMANSARIQSHHPRLGSCLKVKEVGLGGGS